MKKVLISKKDLSNSFSGATRTVYEQIDFFNQFGWEVHIVGNKLNSSDLLKNKIQLHKVMVVPWKKGISRRLNYSTKTLQYADKIKPDLVIGHGDLQNQDILCLHNSVHLANELVHGQRLAEDNELYKIFTPILQNSKFNHIVANSNLMKNDLIARFKIPSEDITVIYPAEYISDICMISDVNRFKFRQKLNIDDNKVLVGLITSGDFKKRGVDKFLLAINNLSREIAEKSEFLIIGKDKLNNEMKELLKKSPFRNKIHILSVQKDINNCFNALDVFVLPARFEEFGRVVVEAMSCGKPVITTNKVGASEIFSTNAASLIYDGCTHKLVELLQKVIINRSLRERIGQENIIAVKTINKQNTFKKFKNLYLNKLI